MKLIKVALLGVAMIALSACNNKCEHQCECKAPDTISKKTAYNLFKDTYSKLFENSVFECERKSYDKDENGGRAGLYASDNFAAQLDESFVEFSCSEQPSILKLLCDRTNENHVFAWDGDSYQDSSYKLKFPNDTTSDSANDVGRAFTVATKEYMRIYNGLSTQDSVVNYECNDYISTFDYLNDKVTMECGYGKGGLNIKRMTFTQDTGLVFLDLTFNFLSFGDATPEHLL